VTSERLSGEVKLQAEREAELLLKETQSKAEVIIRDAELQKRQLLKTAEVQIQEANAARQKAEEAAKQIRERSIQDAALQKQRANKMVAGLKEDLNQETKHAQELAQLRKKSKTVIVQLKNDIAKLKTERGQMVEQLNVYDKNLAELEHKVASKTELTKQATTKAKHRTPKNPQTTPQNSPDTSGLKTRQVANVLSSNFDSLMSDSFISDSFISDSLLPESKLGLASSEKLPAFRNSRIDLDNPHDISYPKMDITHNEANPNATDATNPTNATDPMNITITPLDGKRRETGRYSRERQLEKEHISEQQIHFVDDEEGKLSGLSQHVYPPYPVKESSVQDRGKLITPPTVYDVENPFSNDGFDEIDSLGTFSEAMLSKDTPLSGKRARGAEFDSNIFDVEDTLELPSNKATVEHIEVLDTEWFENFELEDDDE